MNLEYSDNYARAFADLAESQFKERMFPNDLLDNWYSLVNVIQNGYNDVPPEFDNDVDSARSYLDYFLNDEKLNSYPEHKLFSEYVLQTDKKFIEATQTSHQINIDSNKWWVNRFPRFASRAYVDFLGQDFVTKHGLTIKVVG